MIHALTLIFYFQVWAAVPPWKQGSLAEFVTLTEFEVSTVVILRVLILFNPYTFPEMVRGRV